MQVTQISIKNNSVRPSILASFLKLHTHNDNYPNSLNYYLDLAKKLISGQSLRYANLVQFPDNDYIDIFVVEVLSQEDIDRQNREAMNNHYNNLLEKGAAGDVQAALAFCKAVKEGKYAMYGIAYA